MAIELKDFIPETLRGIISGVGDAQAHAAELGAAINPHGVTPLADEYQVSSMGIVVAKVEFDIAVTTAESDKAEGGAGFLVTVIGVGFKGAEETTRSAVNRVSFAVPVRLPIQRQG